MLSLAFRHNHYERNQEFDIYKAKQEFKIFKVNHELKNLRNRLGNIKQQLSLHHDDSQKDKTKHLATEIEETKSRLKEAEIQLGLCIIAAEELVHQWTVSVGHFEKLTKIMQSPCMEPFIFATWFPIVMELTVIAWIYSI